MNTLSVSGMGCESCVAKITNAIQALDAKAAVKVDLSQGQLEVESSVSLASIREAISAAGFSVKE